MEVGIGVVNSILEKIALTLYTESKGASFRKGCRNLTSRDLEVAKDCILSMCLSCGRRGDPGVDLSVTGY